jgi:hypothetical protein
VAEFLWLYIICFDQLSRWRGAGSASCVCAGKDCFRKHLKMAKLCRNMFVLILFMIL